MRSTLSPLALARELLDGSRRALARALTLVENEDDAAAALLSAVYPHTGRAWVIGVTGAPGTGKSTLVTALARAYRAAGQTVGILAVDPTSPFTGGAILGDRIRMRDLAGDAGVFIRSMATRGHLGGLAKTTLDAVRVLDAAGLNVILLETVGAGQSEVDVAGAAYTTLVVEAPGLGDDVQAIKAGILEIADVLVVNKADRPGADHTVRALRAMLELGHPTRREWLHHGMSPAAPVAQAADTGGLWLPPIVQTVASEGTGVEALVERIAAHRDYLAASEQWTRWQYDRVEREVLERLRDLLLRRVERVVPNDVLSAIMDQIVSHVLTPQAAAEMLLNQIATDKPHHRPVSDTVEDERQDE